MIWLWRIWLKTCKVWLQFLVRYNNSKNMLEYISTLNNEAICWKGSKQSNIVKFKLRGRMHCSIRCLQERYVIVQVHWKARSGILRWWSCCIVQHWSHSSCQGAEVLLAYQVFCIATILFKKFVKVTSFFKRSMERKIWPTHLLKPQYLRLLRW